MQMQITQSLCLKDSSGKDRNKAINWITILGICRKYYMQGTNNNKQTREGDIYSPSGRANTFRKIIIIRARTYIENYG